MKEVHLKPIMHHLTAAAPGSVAVAEAVVMSSLARLRLLLLKLAQHSRRYHPLARRPMRRAKRGSPTPLLPLPLLLPLLLLPLRLLLLLLCSMATPARRQRPRPALMAATSPAGPRWAERFALLNHEQECGLHGGWKTRRNKNLPCWCCWCCCS